MPHPPLIFSQLICLFQIVKHKFTYKMTNSADPDQLASLLFAKTGHIWVQKDQGYGLKDVIHKLKSCSG